MKFTGLDRLVHLWTLIQRHGGVRAAYAHFYRTDDIKDGVLIGEDKYGNKYFQNDRYFYGRNRWVSIDMLHASRALVGVETYCCKNRGTEPGGWVQLS